MWLDRERTIPDINMYPIPNRRIAELPLSLEYPMGSEGGPGTAAESFLASLTVRKNASAKTAGSGTENISLTIGYGF